MCRPHGGIEDDSESEGSGEAITKFQDGTEPLRCDAASCDYIVIRETVKTIFEQGQQHNDFFSIRKQNRSSQNHADLRGGDFALTAQGALSESQRPCVAALGR